MDCEAPFNEINTPAITITSPNYPNEYDNNLSCQTIIKFPTKVKNNRILSAKEFIQFETFDLENSPSCKSDYLEFRDGDNINAGPIVINQNGVDVDKFCGTNKPPLIDSSRNALVIIFKSNGKTRSG